MKCFRYAIEGYEDIFHQMGYFKGYKIFIPSPYNFYVFTIKDKIKCIKRQDMIDNFEKSYEKEHYGFNPTFYEIDIDDDLIKNLYNNLVKDEEINKERDILVKDILKFESDEEKIEKLFEEGLNLFESEKYDDAIEKFKCCINNNKFAKSSYYNLARCYSYFNDKKQAIENLKKAIESGYKNWFHIISGDDLIKIVDEPEVVEIIRNLLQEVKSDKKPRLIDYKKSFENDIGYKYVKKHKLTDHFWNYG